MSQRFLMKFQKYQKVKNHKNNKKLNETKSCITKMNKKLRLLKR